MSKRDDGGWAFPVKSSLQSGCGMTLRQWYAGLAMQGLVPRVIDSMDPIGDLDKCVAQIAFQVADALIAEDKEAEK